jgi:hypothetical protein
MTVGVTAMPTVAVFMAAVYEFAQAPRSIELG